MTDQVVIYTRPGCHFCESAKALLTKRGQSFSELVLGEDVTLEDFKSMHPLVGYVPYVIINGAVVGGYAQLVEHYQNRKTYLTE